MSLLLLWPSSGTVCPPWTLSTSAFFLVSVKLLCSLSILSVFLLYFLTSPRLLYDLRVSFLPTFFPLSEANLCYPSHLQTSCYFLLWGSFRRSSNLSSSVRLLCDSPNFSTSSLVSPKLLWLPFSFFLPLTEVTLEHFQSFFLFHISLTLQLVFSEVWLDFLGLFQSSFKVHGISAACLLSSVTFSAFLLVSSLLQGYSLLLF